ncbi:MAG: nucleotidyltransferase family protein [Sedimenticola sp.]
MSQHSSEITLLLAACRPEPDNRIDPLLQTLADDIDWTRLIETSLTHSVAGLLCNTLLKTDQSLVPEDIRDAAAIFLEQAERDNQEAADQLVHILITLDDAGIEAIPFKGPTLAVSTFGKLNLRSFADLDFLIRSNKIEPCLNKLKDAGFKQNINLTRKQRAAFLSYSGQDVLYGHGTPLEPHWAFAPNTLAINIDYAGIFQRASKKSFNNSAILSLSPEDELIALCIHGSKENWKKLKWVADVAWHIRRHPDMDMQGLFSLSETQGVARMVRTGMILASKLLKETLSDTARNWIDKDAIALKLANHLTNEFFCNPGTEKSVYQLSQYHWAMRERLRDRWRYLFRTVTQPRESHFIDVALPDSLFFLYTPYKMLHDYIMLPVWLVAKKARPSRINPEPTPKDIDAPR